MAKGAALRAARDAALAPIGTAAAAALAVLAQQLADGQITEAEFVDNAQLQLGMSYAQAMQVAQQQAAQDYGIAVEDDPTEAAMARAAKFGPMLGALAALITSGVSEDQQAARVDFYAGTMTGAWENTYVGAVTDMTDQATFTWVSSGDASVCAWCEDMDGTELTADDLGGALFPGDATDFGDATDGCEGGPQCFPAGTVMEGAVVGGLRARYSGELVELRTASGAWLAVTPNHPVATPQGFVAAGLLRQGDHVFSKPIDVEEHATVDVQHDPAPVEEIFGSLQAGSAAGSTRAVRATRLDLHGDGRNVDGNIDVVWADRQLLSDGDLACRESTSEFGFVPTNCALISVAGLSHNESRSFGARSFGRLPCCTEHRQRIVRLLPSQPHRLGPSARTITGSDDAIGQSGAIDTKVSGELLHAGAGFERSYGSWHVDIDSSAVVPSEAQLFGLGSQVDVSLKEPASKDTLADRDFLGELAVRFPGFVAPDEIVEVGRRRAFEGHVYDLQTVTGWQLANRVLVSNCRCTLEPNDVVVNSDETLAASGGTMTDTLTADTGPDGTPEPPSSFAGHAYLIPEGVRSGDGRQIAPGALVMGETPLPWMYKPVNSPEHDDAVVAGRIDSAERQDNGMWYAQITFSDSDVGREAMAAAADQSCRFVSADVYGAESQVIVVQSFDSDGDDDGDVQDAYLLVTKGEIRGATQLPFPAFSGCTVAMADVALDDPDMDEMLSVTAAGGPVVPPAAWFADPGFAPGDGRMVQDTRGRWACPLQRGEDGEVFGHIASFRGAEHIGYADTTRPPRSKANYAYFRTGSVRTTEGTDIPVGQLTMGCGHCPDDRASGAKARQHYDGGPGAVQVCDVAVGDDEFGIWVHGAVRPGVTDEQLREFFALAPSGDWRKIGGHLELVACVQVPVPGFPVPRSLAASGDMAGWPMGPKATMNGDEIISLVAAGRVVADPHGSRFARLEGEIGELRALVGSISRERLLARLAH